MYVSEKRIFLSKDAKDKVVCPHCGGGEGAKSGKPVFKPYIDIETGRLLPMPYGICDRDSCSASKGIFPDKSFLSTFFNGTGRGSVVDSSPLSSRGRSKRVSLVSPVVVERGGGMFISEVDYVGGTLPVGSDNALFRYFLSLGFSADAIGRCFILYGVRCLRSNPAVLCFPYVSPKGKLINEVQCLYYGSDGKKDISVHPLWYYYDDYMKKVKGSAWVDAYGKQSPRVNVFFGSHLLNNTRHRVQGICVVEGAKTALLCSLFYPDITWLGAVNKFMGSRYFVDLDDYISCTVHMIPDRGQFNSWMSYCISSDIDIEVCDALEYIDSCDDIADVIGSDRDTARKILSDFFRFL